MIRFEDVAKVYPGGRRAVEALESSGIEDLLVSLRPPAPARAGTHEGT